MTILISLLSDTFLSKFQKKAERFGMKGGEDARYRDLLKRGRKWDNRIRRLFRRRSMLTMEGDKDLESGETPTGDEILEEEIMDEVHSIQDTVEESIRKTEGGDENLASVTEDPKELDDDAECESSARQRRLKCDETIDSINEEEVERAIRENRGELDEHED